MSLDLISQLIRDKTGKVLSIYLTAGYPKLNDTVPLVLELSRLGVDFVEIGMPFSDPVSDGPTIQRSSEVALKNGMSLRLLFNQISQIREKSQIPIILMGYLNPILQFGMENFCRECRSAKVSGVILPDLPLELYLEQYKQIFDQFGISLIFLITPQTSNERIKFIDKNSKSFIYAVSSAAVTGGELDLDQAKIDYLNKLKNMKLSSPIMVGFGLSSKQDIADIGRYADGGIIGSAFIRAISGKEDPVMACRDFVSKILV